MSIRVTAIVATAISGFAVFTCLFLVPKLMLEVDDIRAELDAEMSEFRVLSNNLWKEMIGMSGSPRARRQAYGQGPAPDGKPVPPPTTPCNADGSGGPGCKPGFKQIPGGPSCNCDSNNQCPPGPPGEKGEKGEKGVDGPDGIDGIVRPLG